MTYRLTEVFECDPHMTLFSHPTGFQHQWVWFVQSCEHSVPISNHGHAVSIEIRMTSFFLQRLGANPIVNYPCAQMTGFDDYWSGIVTDYIELVCDK